MPKWKKSLISVIHVIYSWVLLLFICEIWCRSPVQAKWSYSWQNSGTFLRHSLRFLQQTHRVERGELHTHTHTERERERERRTKRRRWCGRWVHCVRRCTRSHGDLYDTPRSAGSTTGVIRQNYGMSGDSTTITVWGKWFIFWSIASIKKPTQSSLSSFISLKST